MNYGDKVTICKEAARHIRVNIIQLAYSAGNIGAHLAPSLSIADILAVLYMDVMHQNDRLVLSKGHGALCWYAAMHEAGIISKETLDTFEQNGGSLPGQPSRNLDLGIEYSSGSLGLGMSYAAGLAWDSKRRGIRDTIYVLLGDGELNEGIVWEGLMFAKQYKLDNIVAIVDRNGMQSDGYTKEIMNTDLEAMWSSFGWHVITCDGHNIEKLLDAFHAEKVERPTVIIADTIKGKGISFMENAREWHHNHLNQAQYETALSELGGNYDRV